MYKDHKKEPGKTRPVVTGCSSNSRGLSNCVSNFLESVANCNASSFESISGEDMLSKSKVHDKAVDGVLMKWKAKREAKLDNNCRKCKIEEIIKRCSKCNQADNVSLTCTEMNRVQYQQGSSLASNL